jgi:hypothetical protein
MYEGKRENQYVPLLIQLYIYVYLYTLYSMLYIGYAALSPLLMITPEWGPDK